MVVLYMAPEHKRQGPPEQRALRLFYEMAACAARNFFQA